jgi:hypothetical protein
MNFEPNTPNRQAAVNGLAVLGFIALVAAGIWLAIYSTRYVPTVVTRLGEAAVYLGSVFNRGDNNLEVVPSPSATSTITFGDATSTEAGTTDTPAVTPTPTAGPSTATSYTETGTPVATTPALHGLADLQISVTAIGYLETASTDSFVESATVPDGERPAIRFTVRNVGTNISDTWRFEAELPSRATPEFRSPSQQALLPGEYIDYTLGFERARTGEQEITITVNPDGEMSESSTANNTRTQTIVID